MIPLSPPEWGQGYDALCGIVHFFWAVLIRYKCTSCIVHRTVINSEVKESRIIKTTTTIKFRWICVSCKNFGKTGGFHTNWPYPQVELKIFLERKARARNFLCFRRQHTSLSTTFWDPTLLQMGKTGFLARSSCQLPHRNRGTQRQFSEKYLFGRRFEI